MALLTAKEIAKKYNTTTQKVREYGDIKGVRPAAKRGYRLGDFMGFPGAERFLAGQDLEKRLGIGRIGDLLGVEWEEAKDYAKEKGIRPVCYVPMYEESLFKDMPKGTGDIALKGTKSLVNTEKDECLTIKEIAKRLGKSPNIITRWKNEMGLEPAKTIIIGKSKKFLYSLSIFTKYRSGISLIKAAPVIQNVLKNLTIIDDTGKALEAVQVMEAGLAMAKSMLKNRLT